MVGNHGYRAACYLSLGQHRYLYLVRGEGVEGASKVLPLENKRGGGGDTNGLKLV